MRNSGVPAMALWTAILAIGFGTSLAGRLAGAPADSGNLGITSTKKSPWVARAGGIT